MRQARATRPVGPAYSCRRPGPDTLESQPQLPLPLPGVGSQAAAAPDRGRLAPGGWPSRAKHSAQRHSYNYKPLTRSLSGVAKTRAAGTIIGDYVLSPRPALCSQTELALALLQRCVALRCVRSALMHA
jgi:hypothetical protein